MMTSIFLAKVFAIVLSVSGIGVLAGRKRLRKIGFQIMDSEALMMLSGFMALVLGALVVSAHNIWMVDWRLIITILGWIMLVKGTMLFVAPQWGVEFGKRTDTPAIYVVAGIVLLVLGITLASFGFMS